MAKGGGFIYTLAWSYTYRMKEHILNAWAVHARMVIYLLNGIDDAALIQATDDKARSVGEIFRHIHNNRLLWIDDADVEVGEDLERIKKDQVGDKTLMMKSLEDSANAVLQLLGKVLDDGKMKGFKRHPVTFLGYLISHEAFHQGEVSVMLTQLGHRLKPIIAFGLWDWESR